MVDKQKIQQSPMNINGMKQNTKQSPLHGVSTEDHDLSTGHGGSKFENSLMENNLRG